VLGQEYDDSDGLHIRNFKPVNKVGIVHNATTKQTMYLPSRHLAGEWSVANGEWSLPAVDRSGVSVDHLPNAAVRDCH
jgi:hypothetical protein